VRFFWFEGYDPTNPPFVYYRAGFTCPTLNTWGPKFVTQALEATFSMQNMVSAEKISVVAEQAAIIPNKAAGIKGRPFKPATHQVTVYFNTKAAWLAVINHWTTAFEHPTHKQGHLLLQPTQVVTSDPQISKFYFARFPIRSTAANMKTWFNRKAPIIHVGIAKRASTGTSRGFGFGLVSVEHLSSILNLDRTRLSLSNILQVRPALAFST